MRNKLIYDTPTRLFHWLFAGLFVVAFVIGKTVDDDSTVFSYHMLAGLIMVFIVILRIVWGFIGTKYARFTSFALHPKDLISYFMGLLSGAKRKWAGHNPASSWAAVVMMVFALGLGITGYLMANGNEEAYEDLHELFANGFLVVAIMHIAGVLLHTIRHKDPIALSMVDGSKGGLSQNDEPILSSKPTVAILFIGLVAAFSIYLISNFNSQSQILHLFGNTLQLGENVDYKDIENSKNSHLNEEHKADHDNDHDD